MLLDAQEDVYTPLCCIFIAKAIHGYGLSCFLIVGLYRQEGQQPAKEGEGSRLLPKLVKLDALPGIMGIHYNLRRCIGYISAERHSSGSRRVLAWFLDFPELLAVRQSSFSKKVLCSPWSKPERHEHFTAGFVRRLNIEPPTS